MAAIDGFMFFRSYYEAIQSLTRATDRCALYDALCAYAFLDQPPQLSPRVVGLWNLMVPNLDRSISRAVANKRRKAKLTAEQPPDPSPQAPFQGDGKSVSKGSPGGSNPVPAPAPSIPQTGSNPVPNVPQTGTNPVPNISQPGILTFPQTGTNQVPNLRQPPEEEERKKEKEAEEKGEGKGKTRGNPGRNEGKNVAGNGAGRKLGTSGEVPRPSPFEPPSVEMVREYCQAQGLTVDPVRFVSYYEACGWMMGRNPMKSWQAALRAWETKETQGRNPGRNGHKGRQMPQEYTLGKSELAAIEKLRRQRDRMAAGE